MVGYLSSFPLLIYFLRKYYSTQGKTQFREIIEYVVSENSPNFPIINEVSSWQQQYYLKKFKSKAEVLSGKKESLVDSILKKSSEKYNLTGFWLVGAHQDKWLTDEKRKELDSTYALVKEKKNFMMPGHNYSFRNKPFKIFTR